jgi:hypothetical protein
MVNVVENSITVIIELKGYDVGKVVPSTRRIELVQDFVLQYPTATWGTANLKTNKLNKHK